MLSVLPGTSGLAAPADTAKDTNSVSELLKKLGVIEQIHSVETLVLESGTEHSDRCAVSKTAQDQISGHIPGQIPGYSAESMVFDMLQGMEPLNTVDMKPIHRWYNSPLAKKIQTAEMQPANYSAVKQYVSVLKTEQQRHGLVKRIVHNTRTTQYVAIIATEVEYAGILHSGCIDEAQQSIPEGSNKTNPEKTLADITRNDKKLTALLLESDITLELAYKLRDFTLTELAQYEYFTASDEATQFYATLTDALHRSFRLASVVYQTKAAYESSSFDSQ